MVFSGGMHGIAPGYLRFYLIPGLRDKETLVHSVDHPFEFLHRDGKGQDIHRNAGSCRRVKHTEHSPRVITLLFKPGVMDD